MTTLDHSEARDEEDSNVDSQTFLNPDMFRLQGNRYFECFYVTFAFI
jgi:hypothetical protein